MIFAREISGPLTSLVKKIDGVTGKNTDCKMGSFVVFCNDDEALEKKLMELGQKEKLSNTILAIDQPSGPEDYKVAKEADITVVFYTERKVVANHAFKKGMLDDKAIEKLLGNVKKILPEK